MTRFSQRAIEKMRDMARVHDTSPPFEGDLRLDIVPRVIEGDADFAIFELETTLTEGGGAATGWRVRGVGAQTEVSSSTESVLPAAGIYDGVIPVYRGSAATPFRGEAWGRDDVRDGPAAGDFVLAVRGGTNWYAVSGGRWKITGSPVSAARVIAAGDTFTMAVIDSGVPTLFTGRTFHIDGVVADCPLQQEVGGWGTLEAHWSSSKLRWEAKRRCPSGDDEEEDPDPDDPEDPPDGGGGGPGDAACYPCNGMPPGVDCSPLNCCPEDDETLTVTDCEEFATAPEEYYVEVPPLSCVPDCATGNEPDATTGLPAGRVTLTHQAGTCTWLSDTFDCGDGVSWQWELVPSLDGRSWLRLYKDAVPFLQWQTSDAWCPRCDNAVTIYCPPDECTDLTAKLCVKPVCTSCADAICYTVDGPNDWTGVSSASFTWQGDDANSGAAVTDNADGRPNPPSRKVTLVYGTVPANVDGAAVVETFPGITFDPTTCGVDLDGVCGIELSVKVQSDDSVGDRGVKVGIAIKQGTDSFIATIGTVREGDGWRTFEVNRLLAADFDKVTATGLDSATHPDWTTPGTAMTFGVGLYAEDDTTDDELGGPITVVANWDILRLCLDSADCTGGSASYTCPDTLTIAACQETGGTATGTITLTNDGASPFTVVVAVPSPELVACGYGGSSFTYGQSPPFGPVAPNGGTWTMTITVRLDAATTCSGEVVITTDLPGEAATCTVPVSVVVLATGTCDPEEPCSTYFNDEFQDDANDVLPDRAAGDITPTNADSLTYGATHSCNVDTKAITGVTWNWWIDGTEDACHGDLLNGLANMIAAWNPLTGVPDNFAAKLGIQQDVATGGYFAGLIFGIKEDNDWYAVGAARQIAGLSCGGGDSFAGIIVARMDPTDGFSILQEFCTDDGAQAIGLHVVGGVAKIAVQVSSSELSLVLLDTGDVTHRFDDVPIDNGGTGVGLVMVNLTGVDKAAGDLAPNVALRQLCVTDQPGITPQWDVAP